MVNPYWATATNMEIAIVNKPPKYGTKFARPDKSPIENQNLKPQNPKAITISKANKEFEINIPLSIFPNCKSISSKISKARFLDSGGNRLFNDENMVSMSISI